MVWLGVVVGVAAGVATAIAGYFAGKLQDFRQRKLKAYEEELPVLIRAVFEPTEVADADLSRALVRLWLLASTNAAKRVSKAMGCLVHGEHQDLIRALQEAIVEVRHDIQFWSDDMQAEDVSHFFINLPKKPKDGEASSGA